LLNGLKIISYFNYRPLHLGPFLSIQKSADSFGLVIVFLIEGSSGNELKMSKSNGNLQTLNVLSQRTANFIEKSLDRSILPCHN